MRYMVRVDPGLVAIPAKNATSATRAFVMATIFLSVGEMLLQDVRPLHAWNVAAGLLCVGTGWLLLREGCRRARLWWRSLGAFRHELKGDGSR
jgi:hypothetical protein